MRKTDLLLKNVLLFFKLTCLYAVISFGLCFATLAHLDNSVVLSPHSAPAQANATPCASAMASVPRAVAATAPSPAAALSFPASAMTGIPLDAKDISFSFDGRYCTYLYRSELKIYDIQSDKVIKAIAGSNIYRPVLMSDRDILLYCTSNKKNFYLHSYRIESDQDTVHKSLALSAGTKIKDMVYSGATGLVFINYSRVRSGIESDTIYCMDVMENVTKLSLSGVIDNMVILNGEKSMYYNDEATNLYLHGKPFAGMKAGRLLGRDAQDRVYVQSVVDTRSISIIEKEAVRSKFTLPASNFNQFYSDGNDLYAIYNDRIVKISGDAGEEMAFDKRLRFIGLGGSTAYFRSSGKEIIGIKWVVN